MDLINLEGSKDKEESICVFLFNNKVIFYSHDSEKEILIGVDQITRDYFYGDEFRIDPNYKIEKDVIVNLISGHNNKGLIYKVNFMKYPVNELYKYSQIEDTIEVFRIKKRFDVIESETLDEL